MPAYFGGDSSLKRLKILLYYDLNRRKAVKTNLNGSVSYFGPIVVFGQNQVQNETFIPKGVYLKDIAR
jgi:hypothetical protein